MPDPQRVPADLIAEGHEIPVARVAAMHEGKRRKRAAKRSDLRPAGTLERPCDWLISPRCCATSRR